MSINKSKFLIFLLGALTAFGPLSIDLYLPAFPAMAKDLGVNAAKLQYSLTSYFIGLAIGQLIYGPISDKFGRKKPLIFGLTLFTLISFLIGLVNDLQTLVALRFVQALGACVSMVITRAIVRDLFNATDIAKVFSLILLVMGAAPIFAPVLGSQILKLSSWRGLFFFLTIYGVLTLIAVSFFIKETLKKSSTIKISLYHYLDLFKDGQFLVASIMSGTVMAGMFSYISSSSVVFMDIFNVNSDIYPLIFGFNALGFITVSQINAKLLNTHSLETVLSWGVHAFFLSTLLLLIVTSLQLGVIFFELSLFLVVSCVGMVMPNITAKAIEFQSHRAGVASALMGSIRFVVASLGTMFVASLGNLEEWAMVIGLCLFISISFSLFHFFPFLRVKSEALE